MTTTLEAITYESIRRAELADPNLRRCLIENCSTTSAVELAHVFSRETPSRVVKAIEWNWGMRNGSLNLDTRKNIFFLVASLHELYKNRRWALLPEESALDQYYVSARRGFCIHSRDDIPKIEPDGLFRYRLLPIQYMEDIYIARQSDADGSVVIHSYPFEDLPIITSHVNPRYAVLHLGNLMRDSSIKTWIAVMKKYPLLYKIEDLYISWTHAHDRDERDPSFLSQPAVQQPDRTPLRRIPVIVSADKPSYVAPRDRALLQQGEQASTSSRHSSPSTSYDANLVQTSKKRPAPDHEEDVDDRPRKHLLTYEALKTQKLRKDLKSGKWTTNKISLWAQDLPLPSHPAPPAPFTSTPKLQLPRRSGRLLAILKTHHERL